MSLDHASPSEPDRPAPRLYLHEAGWRITAKRLSAREYCTTKSPGQEQYHRLNVGEIYVFNDDERLCIACAGRRGIISFEPKVLRESLGQLAFRGEDLDEDEIAIDESRD